MKKVIKISIGIPAFNEERSIKKILKMVSNQKQKDFKIVKIFVYSDASTDRTNKLVREANISNVKLLEGKLRVGKTGAIKNILIEAKKINSEFVVLIDADLFLPNPNVFDNLAKRITKNQDVIAVSGQGIPNKPKNFAQEIANFGFQLWMNMISNKGVDQLYFRSSDALIILRVNAFPESKIANYSYMHDEFYYLYAKKIKKIFDYEPLAEVRFNFPSKISDYILQMKRYISRHFTSEELLSFNQVNIFSLKDKIISLILSTVKNPVLGISYAFVEIFIHGMANLENSKIKSSWNQIASTK